MKRSIDIAQLLYAATRGTLTAAEQIQLDAWLQESPENQQLMERLKETDVALEKMDLYAKAQPEEAWKRLAAELKLSGDPKVIPMNPDLEETSKFSGQQPVRQSFISRPLWRYAAAVLLPVLAGLWYWLGTDSGTNSLAGIDQLIVPGAARAVLTLADGSELVLEPVAQTQTISQTGAAIHLAQQQLTYEAQEVSPSPEAMQYNVLRTPAGGTFAVTLADGSRVVLNAGSTLEYPVVFSADERSVKLTGEAFFEVAHTGAPFIVKSDLQQVQVLGTRFNVSAYDQSKVLTTLVEGSVRVAADAQELLLQPGEQAALLSGEALTKYAVQTSHYTSWMDGKIQFNNETLEEVMVKLGKWYDFRFQFEQDAHRQLHFTGRISNTQPISEVLKMLEITTNVHFRLEDRMIIIY